MADTYTVAVNGTLITTAGFTGSGVLRNYSEPDGDTVTIAAVSPGTNKGDLTLNSDGSFTYTNTRNTTADAFKYKITDS